MDQQVLGLALVDNQLQWRTQMPIVQPPSLRKAINRFCASCLFDPKYIEGGDWLQQVTACTSTDCPLFLVRPGALKPQENAFQEERSDAN